MENQKIINLLDEIDTHPKHFATKKWHIINDENNTNCGVNKDTGADNPDTIKCSTRVLKPNLCDYAEAYILINGTIRAAVPDANTRLALKNCASFTKCNLEINDEHLDTAENLDITMPLYNLIEYSDNYQDSSATLYQLMMVMQYLLLMTQKCAFQLLLCQRKIIKILLTNKIKDFKDLFIGTNIKQKK